MKNEFYIDIPFFPGFYETWAYYSDMGIYEEKEFLDDYNDANGTSYTEDDIDFDFDTYKKDVCEAFAEAWNNNFLPDCVWKFVVEEIGIDSPKYYNYRTDRVFTKVILKEGWLDSMLKFIEDNNEWFKERIYEDWTSRSGFISFMDHHIDEWIDHLKNEEENYIEETIKYMAYMKNNSINDSLADITMENIYYSNYISIK